MDPNKQQNQPSVTAIESVENTQEQTNQDTNQPSSQAPQELPQIAQEKALKKEIRNKRIKKFLKTLVLLILITVGYWQHQNIVDWWNLRNYQPTVSAAELARNTSMTDKGRKIFYLQKPALQDKNTFYVSCEEGETSIVLGCYKPGKGIYLLDVKDDRLNGVEEVTAAHEMLHTAYTRLSFTEQNKINKLLKTAFDESDDQDLKDKIKLYQDTNADIIDELHSILGTEIKTLSPELEAYYSKYFSDRSKIVGYAMGYKAEFTNRKAKVDNLDKELKTLEQQINANNSELTSMQSAINAEGKRLDGLLKAGDTKDYNAGVSDYNASLTPFRNKIAANNKLVSQYKSILSERNKLAEEAQELTKALDSRIRTNAKDI